MLFFSNKLIRGFLESGQKSQYKKKELLQVIKSIGRTKEKTIQKRVIEVYENNTILKKIENIKIRQGSDKGIYNIEIKK